MTFVDASLATRINLTPPGGDAAMGAAGLSPDALIAFVELNLSNTDNQVQQLMSTMNSNKDSIAAFQQLSSLIRGMKGQSHDVQQQNINKIVKLAKDCGLDVKHNADGSWKVSVPAGCKLPHANELKGDVQEELNAWHAHDADKKSRPSDALEAEASNVDAIANKLSSGSEITMLKLQSLVQERTRIIQFASNVTNALNEGLKTEVNNIRA